MCRRTRPAGAAAGYRRAFRLPYGKPKWQGTLDAPQCPASGPLRCGPECVEDCVDAACVLYRPRPKFTALTFQPRATFQARIRPLVSCDGLQAGLIPRPPGFGSPPKSAVGASKASSDNSGNTGCPADTRSTRNRESRARPARSRSGALSRARNRGAPRRSDHAMTRTPAALR